MGETDDEDDFDMAEVIEEYDEGDILSSVHAYLAVDKTWSLKERAALTLKNQSTFGYIAWALSGYSARLYVESEEYNMCHLFKTHKDLTYYLRYNEKIYTDHESQFDLIVDSLETPACFVYKRLVRMHLKTLSPYEIPNALLALLVIGLDHTHIEFTEYILSLKYFKHKGVKAILREILAYKITGRRITEPETVVSIALGIPVDFKPWMTLIKSSSRYNFAVRLIHAQLVAQPRDLYTEEDIHSEDINCPTTCIISAALWRCTVNSQRLRAVFANIDNAREIANIVVGRMLMARLRPHSVMRRYQVRQMIMTWKLRFPQIFEGIMKRAGGHYGEDPNMAECYESWLELTGPIERSMALGYYAEPPQ